MNLEEKEYEVLLANVREFMASRKGQSVMWEILTYCDMYSSVPGKFEAGKRNVGLDIMTLLANADPVIYPKLLLENTKNEYRTNSD